MKIVFYISIITISLGGSLYLLLRYNEYDKKLTEEFFKLFVLLGLCISFWGAYFLYSGETIWVTFKGPVNGAQFIVVGLLITFFSGYQAFKLMKRKRKL